MLKALPQFPQLQAEESLLGTHPFPDTVTTPTPHTAPCSVAPPGPPPHLIPLIQTKMSMKSAESADPLVLDVFEPSALAALAAWPCLVAGRPEALLGYVHVLQ